MKVYIGQDCRCHSEPGTDTREYETDFFDDRPGEIEQHRCVPIGESWTRSDGTVFHGEMISRWVDNDTLPDYLRVKELEAALAEIQEALDG